MEKELILMYARQSRYTPADWHSTMHSHYFTEVLLVTEGVGELQLTDRAIPLRPGTGVVVNPYVLHTEHSSKKSPLAYLVFGVDRMRLADLQAAELDVVSFRDDHHTLRPLLDFMVQEYADRATDSAIVLNHMVTAVMTVIARDRWQMLPADSAQVPRDAQMLKDYLDAHFKEHLTLADLAFILHLDKFHLIKIFRESFGDTPMNYVLTRRLAESMTLLRTTDYAIGQIAEIAGFESQSYFNQVFKTKINVSPSLYRRLAHASAHALQET